MVFTPNERDLDPIQLEELHGESGYAAWFAGEIGLEGWRFASARHSVSGYVLGKWGETDVLAMFEKGGRRCAVLIEDKLAAAFQPEQAERYVERAKAPVDQGEADEWRTVLVAPQSYLAGVPEDAPWRARVSVEAIAGWFKGRDDAHARWRFDALERALRRNRVAMNPDNEDVVRFSAALSAYLERRHAPTLWHNAARDKTGPIIRCQSDGRNLMLWWKYGVGRMTLSVEGPYVGVAETLTLPPDVAVVKHEKSDSLTIPAPAPDLTQPFEDQIELVEDALDGARLLISLVPKIVAAAKTP